ncbi:MAG: hypothetical protein U1F27_12120 [Turneriella sp.]
MIKHYLYISIFVASGILPTALFAEGSAQYAKMAVPSQDPKKKKAGEECKATSECQHHHTCVKSGEKSVCTAPKRDDYPGIPNT